jgi:beta-glucosidase/6-phospho-beta-glucosidase/beta-galactosidase
MLRNVKDTPINETGANPIIEKTINFLSEEGLFEELHIFQKCIDILKEGTNLDRIKDFFHDENNSYFLSNICIVILDNSSLESKREKITSALINRLNFLYNGFLIGFGNSALQVESHINRLKAQDRIAAQRLLVLVSQQIESAIKKGDLESIYLFLQRTNEDHAILEEFISEVKLVSAIDKSKRKEIAAKYGNIILQKHDYTKGNTLETFYPGDTLALDDPNNFKEYLEILKQTGVSSCRMSIRWARVIDDEGRPIDEGIAHYVNQIKMVIDAGLEPLVVLHHFDMLPGDEWVSNGIRERYSQFTELMLSNLIPLGVKKFIPINEPAVAAGNSYMIGVWYPFKKNNIVQHLKAVKNMASATQDFYKIAHRIAEENNTEVEVIMSSNLCKFQIPEGSGIKNKSLETLRNLLENIDRLYLWFVGKNNMDAIGIQYYWSYKLPIPDLGIDLEKVIAHSEFGAVEQHEEKEVLRAIHGNLLEPHLVYDVIKKTWQVFKKPIYVTEFGANISSLRPEVKLWYFKESVKAILKAISEGIPVKGFWAWTLIRNFEILGIFGGGWQSDFGYAGFKNGHGVEQYMIDGIPVAEHINKFISSLKEEFPKLKGIIEEQFTN